MRLSRAFLVWVMLPAWCLAADEPPVIPLWPSGAPGSEGKTEPEVVAESGKNGVHDRHISRVHNPTLTVYLPPRDKANGTAVVICPGGGHRILAIDHEGYDVARRLNEMGVAALRAEVPPGADRGGRLQGGRPRAGRRPPGDPAGPQPRRGMGDRSQAGRPDGLLGRRRAHGAGEHAARARERRRRRPDRSAGARGPTSRS